MVKNLKALRTESGLSQQQLADMLGISQQSVNKYENSSVEPDIDTLIALADIFDVSVDFLIGHTDVYEPYPVSSNERLPFAYRQLTTDERIYADAMINAYIKAKKSAAK